MGRNDVRKIPQIEGISKTTEITGETKNLGQRRTSTKETKEAVITKTASTVTLKEKEKNKEKKYESTFVGILTVTGDEKNFDGVTVVPDDNSRLIRKERGIWTRVLKDDIYGGYNDCDGRNTNSSAEEKKREDNGNQTLGRERPEQHKELHFKTKEKEEKKKKKEEEEQEKANKTNKKKKEEEGEKKEEEGE